MKRLLILGSTGSIGTQALDVVARAGDAFEIVGLSAERSHEALVAQARAHGVRRVALSDPHAAARASEAWTDGEVLSGPEGLVRLVAEADADLVLNAIVGSAGLGPTIVALTEGVDVALANKESLVVGGELVMALCEATGAQLVPVDSEHAALHQLLAGERPGTVESLVLTASGGPFRGRAAADLEAVTVEDALRHPTWAMGGKITIDSATLMNKGLEVIEAHYLFDLDYSQIHVLIHPEGIVHGMAEFRDGSLRAEMATADMRLPIQLALAWPERLPTGVEPVPLTERQLTFEPVDREAFPAVDLAYRVGGLGLTFPAVMNAANEVAVMAFLEGKIPLTRIVDAVQTVVDEHEPASIVSVVNIERADAWARHRAAEIIEER